MKSIITVALLTILTTTSSGSEFYYEKVWNGHCYTYQKVYYQPVVQQQPVIKQENKTTVINNLIGIPVPVQYNQPIAQQGTTVYGYSSVAESYGNIDLGLLYNQAARLTDQAQQLAGQAAADFQTLVQAEGANRAEVAKIIAQGQAAREALLAARGNSTQQITQRSFNFKVTQDSTGELKIEKMEQQNNNTNPNFNLESGPQKSTQQSTQQSSSQAVKSISDILTNKCVSCHGNTQAAGGLNFLKPITDQQQASVLERIVTPDPEKRMPKDGRLSTGEIKAFFEAMGKK